MINKAISASGYSNNGAVARNAGGPALVLHRGDNVSQLKSALVEPNYNTWSLGTGVAIDVTGLILFNQSSGSYNGALNEAILVNRGSTDLYIGFNNNTPAVSNGLQLSSGESYQLPQSPIHTIWAISLVGVGILAGQGIYGHNPNTI